MKNEDVILRVANRNDSAQMAEIEKKCFSEPWSEDAFKDALKNEDYLYVVALNENIIVGMAGIIISADGGYVTNVAVLPEYRNKGIAFKILEELMIQGINKGVCSYMLEVRESNTSAIKLYEKIGFVNVGKRPGMYEHPHEDAYVFTKDIIDG